MSAWLEEFRRSWTDRNFICAILIFVLSYLSLAGLALLVSHKLYMLIVSGIAGWQVAGWSYRLAPKLKAKLFKD
jgi:hypothetical protein